MPRFERFPTFIKPTEQAFHLMPAVKWGPLMADGRQQRVQSAAPHWVARAAYMISTDVELREFRAYVTKMAGGANEFIMPVHDRRQAPWPSGVSWTTAKPNVSWSGGRDFSVALVRQQIRVRAAAQASAGQNYLTVTNVLGGQLQRGNFFSIVDDTGRARLYQIDEVPRNITQGVTGDIQFNPPLRAKVDVNQVLDFDDPACTMTLDRADSGTVTIEGNYIGRAELTLRESFGGF